MASPFSSFFSSPEAPQIRLDAWPEPGQLSELDVIYINSVGLPLAEAPDVTRLRDIDRKKTPGGTNQTFVSKGHQSSPVRIRLRLWRDARSKVDWFDRYMTQVRPFLMPDDVPAGKGRGVKPDPNKKSETVQSIAVIHPLLEAEGVRSLIFTEVGSPRHEGRQVFTVELVGEVSAKVKSGEARKVRNDPAIVSRAQPQPATPSKKMDPSRARRP